MRRVGLPGRAGEICVIRDLRLCRFTDHLRAIARCRNIFSRQRDTHIRIIRRARAIVDENREHIGLRAEHKNIRETVLGWCGSDTDFAIEWMEYVAAMRRAVHPHFHRSRGIAIVRPVFADASAPTVRAVSGARRAIHCHRAIRADVIEFAGANHIVRLRLCRGRQLCVERVRSQAACDSFAIDAREQIGNRIGRLRVCRRVREQKQNCDKRKTVSKFDWQATAHYE